MTTTEREIASVPVVLTIAQKRKVLSNQEIQARLHREAAAPEISRAKWVLEPDRWESPERYAAITLSCAADADYIASLIRADIAGSENVPVGLTDFHEPAVDGHGHFMPSRPTITLDSPLHPLQINQARGTLTAKQDGGSDSMTPTSLFTEPRPASDFQPVGGGA